MKETDFKSDNDDDDAINQTWTAEDKICCVRVWFAEQDKEDLLSSGNKQVNRQHEKKKLFSPGSV